MKIILTQQGQLVNCNPRVKRTIFPRILGRGDRGVITGFSKRSKKNLMDRFAIIDKEKARNATFITLTYVENMQDHRKAERDMDTFLKRLLREKEGVFGVWKKEEQDRGAIHFHLMVWNLKWLDRDWLRYTWSEVANTWQEAVCSDGETEMLPAFTRIERCASVRKCWYYLAKYIGKEEKQLRKEEKSRLQKLRDQTANALASNEGVYGYPQASETSAGVGLTTAQISPQGSDEPCSSGRWWGWFNRKLIPYAPIQEIAIEVSFEEYRRFRWDLAQALEHTKQTHFSHTVRFYWFYSHFLNPIEMLLASLNGKMVFGWKRTDRARLEMTGYG